MSQFESFVNAELPKRIGTDEDPLSVPAGKVPVTLGIGLLCNFQELPVTTRTVTANENLSGHTVVYLFDDTAFLADRDVHYNYKLGVTTHAALSGASVIVQVSGTLTEPSWLWNPGVIFWGAVGLTQVCPVTGPIVQAGHALSGNSMMVNFIQPIRRT